MSITSESSELDVRVCSGSIIGRVWVLTSATCVIRSQVFRVRYGSVTYYTGGNAQISHDAHIHPEFSPENRSNDVALIRLPQAIVLRDVAQIGLPNVSFNSTRFEGNLVRISGWGVTRSNQISPILQYDYGHLLPNSHSKCTRNWNNLSIRPNLLCATSFTASSRACSGDTGSPLVVEIGRNRLIQIGVATFDADANVCNNGTTLYTRTSSVVSWINSIIS